VKSACVTQSRGFVAWIDIQKRGPRRRFFDFAQDDNPILGLWVVRSLRDCGFFYWYCSPDFIRGYFRVLPPGAGDVGWVSVVVSHLRRKERAEDGAPNFVVDGQTRGSPRELFFQ
jgi:hypothetical protein